MTHPDSSSIARILTAPWQQQRNSRTRLYIGSLLTLCGLSPLGLYAWSEWQIVPHPASGYPEADRLVVAAQHHLSLSISMWMLAFSVLIGWQMLVSNVLEQNRPTLARLVPSHAGRLRSALLAAWAVSILAMAAGPGCVLGAPLAWACGGAAGLALFATPLRWPAMWVCVVAAPIAQGMLLIGDDHAVLRDALAAIWMRDAWLVTAIVVTAGAVALVAMVREEGRGPSTFHHARRAVGRRFASSPRLGCAHQSAHCSRLYAWWMARQLARRDASVTSRLLLGLGPAVHWTSRIRESAWFAAVGGGVCALIVALAAFLGRDPRGALPWLSFSLLTGACTPALRAAAQLYRTRGEQALLVLLPGVPRGARLNRWLAWQMSVLFILSAFWGVVLVASLDAFAEALSPGLAERSGDAGMTAAVAAALLPQVAWQWRRWARPRGASGKEFLPSLAPFLLGGVAWLLHTWAGFDYPAMGVVFAGVASACCAWRWWRMGSEPTAMPMGRLAR